MLYKSTTALITAGLMLGAASLAHATEKKAIAIADLPTEGQVALTGFVAELDGKTEFTLRDADGNTIDISAAAPLDVQKGDRVQVIGMIDSKVLGLGKEIDASSVTVLAPAMKDVTADAPQSKEDAQEDDQPQPKIMRMSFQDTSPAQDTGAAEEVTLTSRAPAPVESVKDLPVVGEATIVGKAVNIDATTKTLEVEDKDGETIKVQSMGKLDTLQPGQKVKVTGVMDGKDKQIVAARVTLLPQG
ncbi:DUF5666 domain-containing protein [Kordiimonas lacus]|uniref:DUF5666 domain-containing protein n=1 Tax=Kordiimonas lacus TaxID=637679 RepID=A0A1G7B6K1_9PROT|nr:DUF5666 domain-containing protein [Kordiimonas lacus]SDE22602.1 hypothetical protein SAMN04488071_2382 [Kordiimonas lacus]